MSGTLPPPPMKRYESEELTAVVPRSTVPGPTIEQIDEACRAMREAAQNTETLVSCEGPCRECACCHGAGMVTPERAAEWRRMHPQGG